MYKDVRYADFAGAKKSVMYKDVRYADFAGAKIGDAAIAKKRIYRGALMIIFPVFFRGLVRNFRSFHGFLFKFGDIDVHIFARVGIQILENRFL